MAAQLAASKEGLSPMEFVSILSLRRSWDSSVGTATRPRAGRPRNRGSIVGRDRRFSSRRSDSHE
jgi:hypothetical protein